MATVLELIGCFAITCVFYVVINFLWRLLLVSRIGKLLGRTLKLKELGSWAVVTGATDGIGEAYAKEFGRLGINVVLISRSLPKLKQVSSALEKRYGIQTKVIEVDFTNGLEIYKRIAKEIDNLDIGILVNNVGMSYSHPEFLANVPDVEDLVSKLINCNINSVVRMTLLVLPKMVERRKGLILNISSIAAALPTPLVTMYSSTKAFVCKFSKDLAIEYKQFGLHIQCVMPGWVATKMSRIRKACTFFPTPEQFVREQLNSVGLETASCGYWAHNLQLAYYRTLLAISRGYGENVLFKMALRTRHRALKKIAQEAEKNGVIPQ